VSGKTTLSTIRSATDFFDNLRWAGSFLQQFFSHHFSIISPTKKPLLRTETPFYLLVGWVPPGIPSTSLKARQLPGRKPTGMALRGAKRKT